MPVIRAIEAMLLPSASIETTVTFFSVLSMFAISIILLTLMYTKTIFRSTYLYTIIMKKKAGRPKVGIQNAKGEVFSVRVTPPEGKEINAAIRRSGTGKPDWLRKALLLVAVMDK